MSDQEYKRTHCAYCEHPFTKKDLAGRNVIPLAYGCFGHALCRNERYGLLIEPVVYQEQQAVMELTV